MRKFILLLFILPLFYTNSHSQDGVTLKIQYSPETKYTSLVEQTSYMELKYSGSKDFLQELKAKGVQNPTITNNASVVETVLKTGKSTDGTTFPLTMEIVRTESSDSRLALPSGIVVYGHGSTNALPAFDSLVAEGKDEDYKKKLLTMMQSMMSQLNFPEQKIKIGQSFTTETPLTIPIGSMTLEMVIKLKYKLLQITNGIAYFDVTSVYTLKSTVNDANLKATGTGKGTMVYDIANNYAVKYQTDSKMTMKVKLENVTLDLKLNGGYIQTAQVAKNAKN